MFKHSIIVSTVVAGALLSACAATSSSTTKTMDHASMPMHQQSDQGQGMSMDCCKKMKDANGAESMQCAMMKEKGMSHASSMPTSVYAPAIARMHEAMTKDTVNHADVDFMSGMLAHHQGAIDMSQIALDKASDPTVRKLAADIIKAQQAEVKLMQQWLADHKAKKGIHANH